MLFDKSEGTAFHACDVAWRLIQGSEANAPRRSWQVDREVLPWSEGCSEGRAQAEGPDPIGGSGRTPSAIGFLTNIGAASTEGQAMHVRRGPSSLSRRAPSCVKRHAMRPKVLYLIPGPVHLELRSTPMLSQDEHLLLGVTLHSSMYA